MEIESIALQRRTDGIQSKMHSLVSNNNYNNLMNRRLKMNKKVSFCVCVSRIYLNISALHHRLFSSGPRCSGQEVFS